MLCRNQVWGVCDHVYMCRGCRFGFVFKIFRRKYYEYILKSENIIRLEMIRQIKCHILDHNCGPINIG